jgi:uncharacterized phage-associated protein
MNEQLKAELETLVDQLQQFAARKLETCSKTDNPLDKATLTGMSNAYELSGQWLQEILERFKN